MHKIKADRIFDGSSLREGMALVLDEEGRVLDLLPADEAGEAIYLQGLLCPGFINAHCHLELSHMKGKLVRGSGLVDFILSLQQGRAASSEEVMAAMQEAEATMLAEGIAGVGDISNTAVSFPLKRVSALHFHTFIEVFGFDPARAEAILAGALELAGRLRDAPPRRPPDASGPSDLPGSQVQGLTRRQNAPPAQGNSFSIVPHAPYSVSEPLFRLLGRLAAQERLPLSIHSQESAEEDIFYREGRGDFARLYRQLGVDASFYKPYGQPALSTWLPWLDGVGKLLLVHNTHTGPQELPLLLERKELYCCLCPKANLYIEGRLPGLRLLEKMGNRLLLGTDSLASNESLSILDEMKCISAHFPSVALEQLLRWATLNGARFFGWENLGSFEPGKAPGVNLITGLEDGRLGKESKVRPLFPAPR